jgi:hypothetical protein
VRNSPSKWRGRKAEGVIHHVFSSSRARDDGLHFNYGKPRRPYRPLPPNSDALLEMGTARFWRGFPPQVPSDAKAFEHAFEVRMLANELLGADEQVRLLMAPKLRAKSAAMSASASDGEIFRVRAVSSQIGWLETSLADAAAQAVSHVELLLSGGAPECSVAIDNQLKVFESYERGLLATWETPAELICVPKYI